MSDFQIDETLKQTYDDYYDGASEWRRLGAIDKAKNIISATQSCPHDVILDIGAGEGSLIQELARLHFAKELYALEISESGVGIIRSRGIEGIKEVQVFDGYSIPYEDDRFDLAILTHVIEHVEYPRQLLHEAGRVAKNVFVEVPLEDTVRASKEFRPTRTGHINFYSYKNIRKLLQTCGFDIISQETTNVSYATHKFASGRKAPFIYALRESAHRMVPGLGCAFFVYHCHLLARKR